MTQGMIFSMIFSKALHKFPTPKLGVKLQKWLPLSPDVISTFHSSSTVASLIIRQSVVRIVNRCHRNSSFGNSDADQHLRDARIQAGDPTEDHGI